MKPHCIKLAITAFIALMGIATAVQLEEMKRVSYAPLADTFREIAPREARHVELGLNGLRQIIGTDVFPFDDAEQASVAVAALDGKI